MLKAGGDVITETIAELSNEIWEEDEIPVEWKTGFIVKLPKKGNLSLCKKLERDYTIVRHQQSIQQSDPKQNIYSPRPDSTQRTGRIQESKILRKTHIYPTTDYRTMP